MGPTPHVPPADDARQAVLMPVVALATSSPARVPGEVALATPTSAKRKPARAVAGGTAYSATFEEWWASYPKRVGKPKAWLDYQAVILKDGSSHAEVMAATANYVADLKRRGPDGLQFAQEAGNFLGKTRGKWKDYVRGSPGPTTLEEAKASFGTTGTFAGVDRAVALWQAAGR